MKIRPVGTKLFHADRRSDRQTDRHDEANSRFFAILQTRIIKWADPASVVFSFFRWRYSPLWALACRTIPLHFSLSITNALHLLTPSTWRSLSTSSLHPVPCN